MKQGGSIDRQQGFKEKCTLCPKFVAQVHSSVTPIMDSMEKSRDLFNRTDIMEIKDEVALWSDRRDNEAIVAFIM